MLVIKVELWPFGQEDKKRLICSAVIANDGEGTSELGTYEAVFLDSQSQEPIFSACHHKRREGFWNLFRNCLNTTEFLGIKKNKMNPLREYLLKVCKKIQKEG